MIKKIFLNILDFFKDLNNDFELYASKSYKIKNQYKQKTFKDDYIKFK